jgi:hypothetical protein
MNELTPLSFLKKRLDVLLKDSWHSYEVETLLLTLGQIDNPLLRDKLGLLKVIANKSSAFYDNALLFLHAVSVINNHPANFDHVPHITSLEIAFAIEDMARLLDVKVVESPLFTTDIRKIIKYILSEEGYSEVIYPFNVVGITDLVSGQTKEDTQNKEKAIEQYVHSMYS